ncbi:hypothetical protein [Flavobacterium sp. K5-23]|uniref:hypothetical protein n=1 Tax=Flavobacterium sp. K5-23 TaxID=2746225 RepID=UPI00200D553C|nr:hypothetical protein [Flavobacterium sp. K5-23]UQD56528.1 hypothetical protein FLAK523_09070 [Flavobacterium sp. K5-23]
MSNIFKVILCIVVLMQVSVLGAQNLNESKLERNVPLIVLEIFDQKFPSQDPVWFSRYQGRFNEKLVFEGKFIFDNRYSIVVYDINGNLLAFAATIDNKEIPDNAIKYMTENYPSFPIVEALLVTRGKEEVTYEIGIYIDNQFVIQVFTKTGDFIKSTKA